MVTGAGFRRTGRTNQTEPRDYARLERGTDVLSRVDGVGSVQLVRFAPNAMRKSGSIRAKRTSTSPDARANVIAAIRPRTRRSSTGALGGEPGGGRQELPQKISLQTLLSTPDQFRDLLILTTGDGASVRLSDVQRVEWGAENYSTVAV